MGKRKKIGLITICPEGDAQQKILSGVMRRCREYDFDLLVFSPLVHASHYNKKYLAGELNIYELINFDMLDGVIVTPLSTLENNDYTLFNRLLEQLRSNCKCPVVSFGCEFGDYEVIYSDDHSGISCLTEHLLEVHNCRTFDVLAGPEDSSVSLARLDGISNILKKYNCSLSKEHIYYGDFWFTSGAALAKRYISGELTLPDAIICLSDHMAIGLAESLTAAGIKVPEQVIVTGFGGSTDALLSIPSITSYASADDFTAAACVDRLAELIVPGKEVPVAALEKSERLCIGDSCGCTPNLIKNRLRTRNLIYTTTFGDEERAAHFGVNQYMMDESYSSELFASSETLRECFKKVYESKYLLKPYKGSFLCVTEDWLDSEKDIKIGYPERMNLILNTENPSKQPGYAAHLHIGKGSEWLFDTKQLLPIDFDAFKKPHAYFFAPLHFEDSVIGYFCLQNSLDTDNLINHVFKTYIRYINNALEMARAKHKVKELSEHDNMTGLLNRRGMDAALSEMLEAARPGDSIMALMIDMDNLKASNDMFGHKIGDLGLCTIAKALDKTCLCPEEGRHPEICVRAGGDEFYLIGIGNYDSTIAKQRLKLFQTNLAKEHELVSAPTSFSASIGYSVVSLDTTGALKSALDKADEAMYKDKRKKKAMRG